MDVTVIVVTYNSAGFIRDCLSSLAAQRNAAFDTVVVDNASSDGTASMVRSEFTTTRLIANTENLGFARGCNLGAASSRARHLYFLNPDARIVGEDGLSRLGRAMDASPAWGIAGTRVLDENGTLKSPATSYPDQNRVSKDFSRLPGSIASVGGASLVARRKIFEKLGGFDPAFFLYGEETDLCLRARQEGYEIGYISDVEVRHTGGGSERGKDPYEVWVRRTKGLHQFWAKHYPTGDVTQLVRRNLRRARFRMLTNGVMSRLRRAGSLSWEKERRYQAVYETSARFLKGGD